MTRTGPSDGDAIPEGHREILTDTERRFLDDRRIARLATADERGAPHAVPVCFAVVGDDVYITIDEKPKRSTGKPLKRLRNIEQNPRVALVVDRYDDHDWSRLGWVMLRGRAEILRTGAEHDRAQRVLRTRYPQYHTMELESYPVIAIRIERTTSWGALDS